MTPTSISRIIKNSQNLLSELYAKDGLYQEAIDVLRSFLQELESTYSKDKTAKEISYLENVIKIGKYYEYIPDPAIPKELDNGYGKLLLNARSIIKDSRKEARLQKYKPEINKFWDRYQRRNAKGN